MYDDNGRIVKSRQCIIKPDGWTIPTQASDVHGITTDYAEEFGIPISEALRVFIEDYNRSERLIAHNINFDFNVVGAELHRSGIKASKYVTEKVCTMEASTDYCKIPGRNGYKWPQLIELHKKLFDKGFDGAHDAMIDVQACARCYFELKKQEII